MAHIRSYNKVVLLGRVGAEPRLRTAKNSTTQYCYFSIATNEKFRGSEKERVCWHNIIAWAGTAKFCEDYLKKGALVLIEGSLQSRYWDSEDGEKKHQTEVRVDSVVLVSSKKREPGEDDEAEGSGAPEEEEEKTDEDPF